MAECYMYLMRETDTGLIKVGVATSLFKRLKAIQTGNASPVELLAIVGAESKAEAHGAERLWKHKFRASHKRGEWYRPTPDLLEVALALEAYWKDRTPMLEAGVPFFGIDGQVVDG